MRRRLELSLATGTKAIDLRQLAPARIGLPECPPPKAQIALENRLDVDQKGHVADPAAGPRWTRSSPPPCALLAIAAGADVA
jgi:hypothetical protein